MESIDESVGGGDESKRRKRGKKRVFKVVFLFSLICRVSRETVRVLDPCTHKEKWAKSQNLLF